MWQIVATTTDLVVSVDFVQYLGRLQTRPCAGIFPYVSAHGWRGFVLIT